MKPQTSLLLRKATEDVRDARIVAGVGLTKVAARLAYYALFHLAEAIIFERTDKTIKTHSGVRSEFARVTRDDATIDFTFGKRLAQFYIYKEIADYAVGDALVISADDVAVAVEQASHYLKTIEALLTSGD